MILSLFVVGSWNTIDGLLLLEGHPQGLSGMTLRQMLNVTYAMAMRGKNDEEREAFLSLLQDEPSMADPIAEAMRMREEMMRPGQGEPPPH